LHDELAARVADAAARINVPGVAVGLYLNGAEDYVYHGVTSVPNPLPVDAGTLFQIGSTGKTFTATAMMALVERGLVDLHAPVRQYLPDLTLQDPEVAANVTVLNLHNHTAGWAGDFFLDTGYGDDALARFVARLNEANQEAPLGERVSYNNAAVSLAGRVIEVVTDQTFETAMQELVLDPLGLTEHFYFPWDIMIRRFAAGHGLRSGELRVSPWYESRSAHPAGGGISASARDQMRYARFHLGDGGGVLRRDTLEQMQTATTPGGSGEQYGIGWHLRDFAGARVVAHGGSTLGHQSAFEMVPERDFALTVMTNARHGSELNNEIVEWVFDAYLGLAEAPPEPLSLTPAELTAYTGRFVSQTGTMVVTLEDHGLTVNLVPNPDLVAELGADVEDFATPPMPMQILPNNEFLVTDGPYKGMRGGLVRDERGRVTGVDVGRVFTRQE
jgi:CubicO group peptidase (beta-lactamase class C family)